MGKTLCSFQTGNVVVLLFYREQGYGCAERGRAVQQGREEDLWQEGNYASLICTEREHTSHRDTEFERPRFPRLAVFLPCREHIPCLHSIRAAGRPELPQEKCAEADSTLVLLLVILVVFYSLS